jgi:hypothetical protein
MPRSGDVDTPTRCHILINAGTSLLARPLLMACPHADDRDNPGLDTAAFSISTVDATGCSNVSNTLFDNERFPDEQPWC